MKALRTRLLAVLVLTLPGGIPTASASSETPGPDTCSYAGLIVPSRVVVRQALTYVIPDFRTDCEDFGNFNATWRGVAADGSTQSLAWCHALSGVGRDCEPMAVEDRQHLGTWTMVPQTGYTWQTTVLTTDEMNRPVIDVRGASGAVLSSYRSGRVVTLTTHAYRYWTSTHAAGTWGRAGAVLQYSENGRKTWRPLALITTDNLGRHTLRYSTSRFRDYRVVLLSTTYVWGSTSAPTRR